MCRYIANLIWFHVAALIALAGWSETSPSFGDQSVHTDKREIAGWTLYVDERLLSERKAETEIAISLLTEQLEEIVRVVPRKAVAELQKVPLWFSHEYPGIPPRAEYHPSEKWLKDNQRNPQMAKGIEFTNIRIFEPETKRMKNFALHELAHAFHDQVLENGFGNEKVKATFDAAKSKGLYDAVEQRFGDGRSQTTRAYALSSPMEFFAEGSEALFSINDFFPFSREQLIKHDPSTWKVLCELWEIPEVESVSRFPSPYQDWKHHASLWIITTPLGANLPESESVNEFPLLVRLHHDTFDFSQCKASGDDIRFADISGTPLPFQIDFWDAEQKAAAIWVRVPTITGNANQEIHLYWGNELAGSVSDGRCVFNQSNGYLTVCHMNESLTDDVGSVSLQDVGTKRCDGWIGDARHLSNGHGLNAGQSIDSYPLGSSPHSTEVWFRANQYNGNIVGWGNEHGQGKVVFQYTSPPSIRTDCYFSNGSIRGRVPAPRDQWVHVVHSYQSGNARLYVNGELDSTNNQLGSPLAIKNPCRLYLGGWYDQYNFEGDIDEVRISNVARSPQWIRLQYENQKRHQTLIGPPVKSGDELGVSVSKLELKEGACSTITANAGGARKLYWILKRDGSESVVATDRFQFTFEAGRVTRNETAMLILKAIYENQTRVVEIPISIENSIPEPSFTLSAPANWNGRDLITVTANLSDDEKQSTTVEESESPDRSTPHWESANCSSQVQRINIDWRIDGVAVIKDVHDRALVIHRAQGTGPMTVTATVDNGGARISKSILIQVNEPDKETEPWLDPPVCNDEHPEDNQFIPRRGHNIGSDRTGRLIYAGALGENADSVFLRVFADDQIYKQLSTTPSARNEYRFVVDVRAELTKYRTEFGIVKNGTEKILHSANNIVCGDVFLIIGQSNAVATDFGEENPLIPNDWVRTFGATSTDAAAARSNQWANATARSPGGLSEIGYWGMELGRQIVESEKIPVCIINGAVGGTRIDQHQRNKNDPTDVATIYGRLLWRVQTARLTHGVRAIIWHQGENDQGADGPTGGYGFETYRQYFVDLAAAWKQDYPNVQQYYAFQIWPKSCAMGMNGSDNRLREVQRSLPSLFSNLTVMSTIGVKPPGGCHFPAEGYAQFAKLLHPLIASDVYNHPQNVPLTPPNLVRAFYATSRHDVIALQFDQAVNWDDNLVSQFYLDKSDKHPTSGRVSGSRVELFYSEPVDASMISYIDGEHWNPDNILMGSNGVAALTFCDVQISER